MTIISKLQQIQTNLKAPKSQRNNFGNYNYRSAEDILEAVKPLLAETKTALTINDDIQIVADRIYVKATATLHSEDGEGEISATAFAREELTKKGMDASQITGATSSYARKYALNGLFAIDDTKDADSTNKHGKEESNSTNAKALKLMEEKGIKPESLATYLKTTVNKLTEEMVLSAIKDREKMVEAKKNKNDNI